MKKGMNKAFSPAEWETRLYDFWEHNGYLKPGEGKTYTVLMPPPNANASLHAGHGMYTVDDVLIRWKRLQGYAAEWVPGMDHAGFETQFVYEKHLKKQSKSRMDFDRDTLYQDIFAFVQENSGQIYTQFKKLGFLADWSRSVFTLDEHVIAYVYETFRKMVADGLVYRDEYIVNYCVHDGTTLADLEVERIDRKDPLYYIRYQLADGEFQGKPYIVVATVRPEPIYADTHLAVHLDNPKTSELIGRKVRNPMTGAEMEIIADNFVDPEFGTGIVKLTPGHDPNDFEVARTHNLPTHQAIDLNGRMIGGPYEGMKVKQARESAVQDLDAQNSIEKIDEEYEHSVITCYRCGRDLEPLTVPNWFIKVESLKQRVREAVVDDKVKFHPVKYKKQMLEWLDVMHDWPISRQIVWGIRMPVWYKVTDADNIFVRWLDAKGQPQTGYAGAFVREGVSLNDIRKGLQKLTALTGQNEPEYVLSEDLPGDEYLPETDTFDTWFSSGQWPLVTLKPEEYEAKLPTDFMGTLADILKFWISRMILFSLYRENKVPFKHVYLWSMVADAKGQKMSKSKGNVVNPITLVEKYGADAFRGSLFFGVAQGGKVNLAEDRIKAMRNYANKVWNIGRYIHMSRSENESENEPDGHQKDDAEAASDDYSAILDELQKEFSQCEKKCAKNMDMFRFSRSFDDLYEFIWHRFADHYLEVLKEGVRSGNIEVLDALEDVYAHCLKLLHPFMPFVTEAVWKEFYGKETSLLDDTIT